MLKLMFLGFTIAAVALALPAGNDILDKATVEDASANDVFLSPAAGQVKPDSPIAPAKETLPETAGPAGDGTFKPQHAGSMFARLIDDIFQIPITVLQSVAKLITNPFKQPVPVTPENSSKY